MRNKKQDLLVITIGFVIIASGGIADFITGPLFWYLLGFMTVPFITAWMSFVLSQMKAKKQAKRTQTT